MNEYVVLVVEDDPSIAEALSDSLIIDGYEVILATDGQVALRMLETHAIDLVLSDVNMAPMDGNQLLRQMRQRFSAVPVILMTAFGTMEHAVKAMKTGAVDYLPKPFEPEMLIKKIKRFLPENELQETTMIAEDLRTREIAQMAHRVAESEATVMILGESGVGKEVLARYIHNHSHRNKGPFIAINCAAIPENMLEAMLFGYEKGAFTGAYKAAPGKFELAQDGTLLLDEISEMSMALQAKLLRVLQEQEVERLGGREPIQLNVRILATSNRRLREEIAAGRFREDLFYRLCVFPITLPALRDRKRDIKPLSEFCLQRHLRKNQASLRIDDSAQQKLFNHAWPGNIRELDNVMHRALILSDGEVITTENIYFEDESAGIAPSINPDMESTSSSTDLNSAIKMTNSDRSLSSDLKSVEEQSILEAIRTGDGTRKNAAELLGISPRTLRYKIAKLKDQGILIP